MNKYFTAGRTWARISFAAAVSSLVAVLAALLLGPAPAAAARWTEAWSNPGVANFGGKVALKVEKYTDSTGHLVYTFRPGDLVVQPDSTVTGAQQATVHLELLRSEDGKTWSTADEESFTVDLGDGKGGSVTKTLAGRSFFHFHTPGRAGAYKMVANVQWFKGTTWLSERNVAASLTSELSCGELGISKCYKFADSGQAFLAVA